MLGPSQVNPNLVNYHLLVGLPPTVSISECRMITRRHGQPGRSRGGHRVCGVRELLGQSSSTCTAAGGQQRCSTAAAVNDFSRASSRSRRRSGRPEKRSGSAKAAYLALDQALRRRQRCRRSTTCGVSTSRFRVPGRSGGEHDRPPDARTRKLRLHVIRLDAIERSTRTWTRISPRGSSRSARSPSTCQNLVEDLLQNRSQLAAMPGSGSIGHERHRRPGRRSGRETRGAASTTGARAPIASWSSSVIPIGARLQRPT